MARTRFRLVWSAAWASSNRPAAKTSATARHDLPRAVAEPSLYEDVYRLGLTIAATDGFQLSDEWPNVIIDWLSANRPEVDNRGVTEDDVRAAFAAWGIGWPR
jgi:hypothetical protein